MCRHLQLLLLFLLQLHMQQQTRHGDSRRRRRRVRLRLWEKLQRKHFGKNFCAMWQAAPSTHTAQDTKCSFVENKQATTTIVTTIITTTIAIAVETKQVNRTNSQRTRFMHFHFVKHFWYVRVAGWHVEGEGGYSLVTRYTAKNICTCECVYVGQKLLKLEFLNFDFAENFLSFFLSFFHSFFGNFESFLGMCLLRLRFPT